MLIQRIVLRIYNAILKRVHSTLLPSALFFLYFSAYGFNRPDIIKVISKPTLFTIHIYAGLFLILLGMILFYDFTINRLIKSKNRMVVDGKTIQYRKIFQSKSYRRMVDFLFYFSMTITGIIGLLLYLRIYYTEFSIIHDQLFIRLLHVKIGLFLISIIILKYYLTLTMWFDRFMHYLKTH